MENRPKYPITEKKLGETREKMYGYPDLTRYERTYVCRLRLYDLRQTLDSLPRKKTEQPRVIKKVVDFIYELFGS
ncbi:MAG: hypothetical protein HY831_01395 [Candidatus Aenigmarchaeota archaeon]|nr:hypothetical protein [Candidatus Aenigmarchaeota archaeon]